MNFLFSTAFVVVIFYVTQLMLLHGINAVIHKSIIMLRLPPKAAKLSRLGIIVTAILGFLWKPILIIWLILYSVAVVIASAKDERSPLYNGDMPTLAKFLSQPSNIITNPLVISPAVRQRIYIAAGVSVLLWIRLVVF